MTSKGNRNTECHRLVSSLAEKGLRRENALRHALDWAETECVPSFSKDEVHTIVHSVYEKLNR